MSNEELMTFMISSMIQFYVRNQNRIPICKRSFRYPRRPVTFISTTYLSDDLNYDLNYKKSVIIDSIYNRTHGYINEKDKLLCSELDNVREAITYANQNYQEEEIRAREKINKLTENWKDMPQEEKEDVEEHIDSFHQYLRDLKYKITEREDKLTREISKREGWYEEYCEEKEQEWEDYNFNVGLYMSY